MAYEPITPPAYDAAFLENAASASVRAYCGWHVAPVVSETLTLDGPGGRTLLVPSMRIREVTKVVNDGRDVTSEVRWSHRSGVMTLAGGWSCDVGAIEVELKHGFEFAEVPDVAAIVVAIGTRVSAGNGTVVQEAAGGMSRRFATTRDGNAPGVPLFATEQATLDRFRLNWRA